MISSMFFSLMSRKLTSRYPSFSFTASRMNSYSFSMNWLTKLHSLGMIGLYFLLSSSMSLARFLEKVAMCSCIFKAMSIRLL